MTIRSVSTDDPDFPRWRRSAALAINSLIASDYQPRDADLDALAALSGTNTIYYRSAANTWTAVTMGSGVSFASGTLSATGTGGTITSVSGTAPIVSSGGTTPAISISAATTSAAGSLSASDKTKLDGIASGATANTGTVTTVSVTTANGVSGSVATATTTPAITLTLGAITPSSVAATGTISGSNLSGTNTGDQTTVSGNAGTATTLQTARNINGVSFNGSANITVPAVDTATPRLIAASNLSDVASATTSRTNLSAAKSGANSDITSITGLSTPLALSQGGVGAVTAAGARFTIGAAASGSNSDISSLSGLITPLSLAQGGTAASSALGARTSLRSSCRTTLSASIATIDFTAGYVIPWDTETWDDASWHSTVTNTERMTVPSGVDRVEFIVGLRLTGLTASVPVQVQILKNGTASAVGGYNAFSSATTLLISLAGADSCIAGDYYTVKVTQTGGSVSGTVASATSVQFVVKAV